MTTTRGTPTMVEFTLEDRAPGHLLPGCRVRCLMLTLPPAAKKHFKLYPWLGRANG